MIIAYSLGRISSRATSLGKGVAYIAWSTIGTEFEQDESDRINIALAGYGGIWHDGAFLTDTIIVASYNPKTHQASLVSIPRDLIVYNDDTGELAKINSILAYAYDHNGRDLALATVPFRKKLQEITWLDIPYYLMIDFDGFVQVIDEMGWLDIYVPEHFLDMAYPIDRSGEEEIFELPAWNNHLSWPNTLKYARSRHSTSDFSRSTRQQQIIKAVLKQVMGGDGITLAWAQRLFDSYKKIVETNISDREILGLAKYGITTPDIAMYGLTSQCLPDARRINHKACVLRDASWWLLPRKAQAWESVNQYEDIQHTVQFIIQHPSVAIDRIPLTILNAIDPELVEDHPQVVWIATRTANILVDLWFTVVDVSNSEISYSWTVLESFWSGAYQDTIQALHDALEYDVAYTAYTWFNNAQGRTRDQGLYLYLWNDIVVSQDTGDLITDPDS